MTSFALIAEGITDQVVISSILYGFYDEEPDITEAQPLRDETDKHRQGNFSNWEKVLEYCGLEHFEQNFLTNDFVVIQIDTDVCEEKNFGIALTVHGVEKDELTLIQEVKEFLIGKIGETIYKTYQDRIIFSIAVHSLECWLIPLFSEKKELSNRTKNCEHHLGFAVRNKKIYYKKESRVYEGISKGLQKMKNIKICQDANVSFDLFVKSLPKTDSL